MTSDDTGRLPPVDQQVTAAEDERRSDRAGRGMRMSLRWSGEISRVISMELRLAMAVAGDCRKSLLFGQVKGTDYCQKAAKPTDREETKGVGPKFRIQRQVN